MRTYRTYLKAAGVKSIAGLKLRTEKQPGDIEIVHVGGGKYETYRHSAHD